MQSQGSPSAALVQYSAILVQFPKLREYDEDSRGMNQKVCKRSDCVF
jgi:hypothetical protein